MKNHIALLLALGLTMAGCSSARMADAPANSDPASTSNSGCIVGALVEPGDRRRGLFRQATSSMFGDTDSANGLSERLINPCNPAQVHARILDRYDGEARAEARNAAVGVVRAASIQRCSDYLAQLTQTDREGNFVLGTLTTIFGGLGAIMTPQTTIRALSGAAGITSGVRSEFNSAFFYNQTIGAITKAIESRRERLWTLLDTKLLADSYAKFSYPAAYAELEHIHGQCSLNGAFAELNQALQRNVANMNQELTDLTETQKTLNEIIEIRRKIKGVGASTAPEK